ncbi:aa3-type cytochrome c oxidase subunit IV [Novosphingobium aquiterrae]|uniref:Aa3-type cytochrome c oxidase subunit IV n=1 Tax=Novosphingobium aquiterrae TaxID=624388 RepID=A0ABV6PL95_9SPHN
MDMASGNDIKAHTSTYSGFLGLVKWGIVITALITALVVFLIS